MALSDICPPETTSGIGSPIVRPPCVADDSDIDFDLDETGKPRWTLPADIVTNRLPLCGPLPIASPTSPNDPIITESQALFVDHPETGERCLTTLPPTIQTTVCSDIIPSAGTPIPDTTGELVEPPGGPATVTWTNTSAWPALITPRWVVQGAEVVGITGRYQLIWEINGATGRPISVMRTTTHEAAAHSSSLETRPVLVQPGDDITITAVPRVSVDAEDELLELNVPAQLLSPTVNTLTVTIPEQLLTAEERVQVTVPSFQVMDRDFATIDIIPERTLIADNQVETEIPEQQLDVTGAVQFTAPAQQIVLDPPSFRQVTWGDYWLCLDVASQVTTETIADLVGA